MNITYHIDDIKQVAQQVLSYSQNKVFILNAPMGAGKTTLVSAICKELGVNDELSSPTFSIVNEYRVDNQSIFHLDLYRLETAEELFNIGIEEYLDNKSYMFVEWPNLITPYLEHFTELEIEIIDSYTRVLKLK